MILQREERREQGTVHRVSGGIHTPGAERPVSGNPAEGHDLATSAQIFQCNGKPLRHHPSAQGEGDYLLPQPEAGNEFLAFAEIARHECEDYYILGGDELYTDVKHTKPLDREIIDVTLINESVDLFMETKRSQQDKPYYVPDKKHLLEYDDPFYCEDTPEKQKLRAFLKERCNLNDERENAVFEELLYGVRSVAVQTGDVLNHLEKLGVQLRSRRDVERFTALYSAFHNTTRMPCNRGYTPDEMMQMTPPEERFKSLSLGPNFILPEPANYRFKSLSGSEHPKIPPNRRNGH